MKVSDVLTGILLMLFGVAILVAVQSFPDMHGQDVGPALFPAVIAVGFLVCGALLSIRGLRTMGRGGRLLSIEGWARDPLTVLRFLSVPVGLLFYVLTSGFLGFHIAASLAMLAWLLTFGLKPLLAAPLAICTLNDLPSPLAVL